MITGTIDAKTLVKHVTYDCKCKFENTACNSNQNGIMKSANVSAKSYGMHKNNFNWNPSICICENGRYLKHIADTLVIVNNEFMNAVDSVSRNATNAIPKNFTTAVSIKSDDKKLRCEMYF